MRGTGRTVERCRYCGNDQHVCCLLGFVCVICEADSFQKYLLTCWKLSGSSCADTHLLVFHFLDALMDFCLLAAFILKGILKQLFLFSTSWKNRMCCLQDPLHLHVFLLLRGTVYCLSEYFTTRASRLQGRDRRSHQ